MKILNWVVIIFVSFIVSAEGQAAVSAGANSRALLASMPYIVVSRGADSAIWQRQTYEQAPDGTIVTNFHRYVELSTGLNHNVGGQWVPSSDQIQISADGTSAAATNGQQQAYFPANIANGVIKLVTLDGKVLRSRPIGLAYSDGSNSVLLAVITNATGAILTSGNQVIYKNAFAGLDADLRYTYTKAGFEQDVVLREQPPDPASLGLNPQSARLQVLTEFFHPPQPHIRVMKAQTAAGNLQDESLKFGAMMMGRGKAFRLNGHSPAVVVDKRWVELSGRQFLIEEVPIVSIAHAIDSLPPFVGRIGLGTKPVVSKNLVLPPQHLTKSISKAHFLALASPPDDGMVLDYIAMNSQANYTFQGDTTYYISGHVNLTGTNTFEGGAVIKYATNASIALNMTMYAPVINWQAGPYRPVVFTAKDDNTVGETISGSTGTPIGYYANPALNLSDVSLPSPITNIRISYANQAVSIGLSTPTIMDAQFADCEAGISCGECGVNLRNALFANVQTNFNDLNFATINAQNTTFASSSYLSAPRDFQYNSVHIALTNCVFANVANLTNVYTSSPLTYRLSGGYNGFYNSSKFGSDTYTDNFYPFQTVGAGSYYLTDGCDFVNAGTTNIDSMLLADLATKTTYPPIIYSNTTITVATVFGPQAQRDTDIPDLGYHYDPLDYAFGGVDAYSNITFTAGTAAGWFQLPGSGGPGYGIALTNQVIAAFNGTVISPCVWARYDTVQEGCDGLWTDKGWLGGLTCKYPGNSFSMASAPQITAGFTHFYALASDPNHFRDYWTPLVAYLRNCELHSGGAGAYNNAYYFTNCLFDDAFCGQIQGYDSNDALVLQNCTFHGGQLLLMPNYNPIPLIVRDCTLDCTNLGVANYGTDASYVDYDYNAYTNGAPQLPGGTRNIVVANFNWQTSWFGNYYLPPNSPLINVGDVAANTVGLYHFTTQTNQLPETNSTVDIGYHYVATDAYGNPLDTDGDGVPDYLEDANGNGVVDNGENSWINYNSANGLAAGNGLVVFTPLK